MADNNKPIDVNGNRTPISRESVREIRADKWKDMTIGELFDQKGILDGRLIAAADVGNIPLMRQLQVGIDQILAIVDQKSQGETRLI